MQPRIRNAEQGQKQIKLKGIYIMEYKSEAVEKVQVRVEENVNTRGDGLNYTNIKIDLPSGKGVWITVAEHELDGHEWVSERISVHTDKPNTNITKKKQTHKNTTWTEIEQDDKSLLTVFH